MVKPRERSAILKSLKTGVVPRAGIHHIQVGRSREIQSLLNDFDDLEQGGSCFRVLIGHYGSGKTFFLSLLRSIAHTKGFCVCSADLAPEKRLYSTSGHARALYSEMIRGLSTKVKPQGAALQTVIEKYLSITSEDLFSEKLISLTEYTLGFDFIKVLKAYKWGFEHGDNDLTTAALKWFRGEYTTKTEAKSDLGVRTIISDDNYYEALKVLNAFLRGAGFKGLLICIDEMVNLMRISQNTTRKNNYERILFILNDLMQGDVSSFGVFLSGTPEFLTDERKGLYTYEAIKSRLQENEFLQAGMFDASHPVIRLQPLSREEMFNLVKQVGMVFESNPAVRVKSSDEMIHHYLQYCSQKLGAQLLLSPRTVIRSYLNLRDALETSEGATFEGLLAATIVQADIDPMLEAPDLPPEDQDLTAFRL